MASRTQAKLGLLIAPAVALAIGVWAEFAHLTPAVLFAVSIPAIIGSTLCAAYLARSIALPLALVIAGAVVGAVTFGLAESTHVAIHLSLGRSLNFDAYHSEAAKAFALIGIHLAVGAMIGAGVGVGLAVLYSGTAFVMRRASLTPTLRQAQGHPSPSSRERGRG